jgi:nitroreductase
MIDILRQRRSIRKYENKPLDEKTIGILKEALLRSPSARNVKPWTFIFIDDRGMLKKLSRLKPHGSTFLEGAPLGIVICGDEKLGDTWIEDCSIASTIVQLTAQSLGLGSCWIHVRNRDHSPEITAEAYVQDLLHLPVNMKVESIISIGYPDEKREPVPAEQLDYDKIKINAF